MPLARIKKIRHTLIGVRNFEHINELSMNEALSLELGGAFWWDWSEAETQRAWFRLRDKFLPSPLFPQGWRHAGPEGAAGARHCPGGMRPWGYWRFELNEEKPATPTAEFARLNERRLLEPWETAAHIAYLRLRARELCRPQPPTQRRLQNVARILGVTVARVEQLLEEE